jgi:phospholipid/cholesterol/gamma-HCH transport system substrate-binding protein
VRIRGIGVGSVTQWNLDPETYDAVVTLTIKLGVKVPKQTIGTIGREGQTGDKDVRLKPEKSEKSLAAGATIDKTEQYQSIEDQVGKIIFLPPGRCGNSGEINKTGSEAKIQFRATPGIPSFEHCSPA